MISPKNYSGPPVRMPSRKSSIIAFVAVSFLLLLYTSRRIGGWGPLDDAYYRPDHHHRPPHDPHHDPHKSHHAPQGNLTDGEPSVDMCDGFPDTSNVLLVMKTGASEAFARVPTQVMTMLKCLPEYLIFSDMDQNIGGVHIHDSLDTILTEAQDGNSDFDLYRRQKWCQVDQENCNKLGNPASEGWNLDKYKNNHIAEKAYNMRPGYDWYLFVDADTYVLWPNLMEWLKKLDPNKKLYLGSVTLIHDFHFGHGGSGYIVSKAAMADFIGNHPGVANKYDVRASKECCGDYMFALALKENTGVGVQQMWPTINGEKPFTLPFGPSHWCQPIVTMHHLNSEEINSFWHFERKREHAKLFPSPQHPPPKSLRRPLILKDIYDEFVSPYLLPLREDWDNRADNRFYLDTETDPNRNWDDWYVKRTKKPEEFNDYEKVAHRSAEDCDRACKSLKGDECFMWKWNDGACAMSGSFQMGKPVKKEGEERKRTMSGWDVEKIRAWIEKQGECGKINWPKVNDKGWGE